MHGVSHRDVDLSAGAHPAFSCRRLCRVVILAALSACALGIAQSAPAAANPSLDQYVPALPEPKGPHAVDRPHSPSTALSPRLQRSLSSPDAAAAQRVVATAPARRKRRAAVTRRGHVAPARPARPAPRAPRAADRGLPAAIGSSVSDGLTPLLVALLAAMLVGGFVARRRPN
jgi:hypothetical protein